MNDCITTTKQSTTKPCAYFLGYTVVSTLCKYDAVACVLNPNDTGLMHLDLDVLSIVELP